MKRTIIALLPCVVVAIIGIVGLHVYQLHERIATLEQNAAADAKAMASGDFIRVPPGWSRVTVAKPSKDVPNSFGYFDFTLPPGSEIYLANDDERVLLVRSDP